MPDSKVTEELTNIFDYYMQSGWNGNMLEDIEKLISQRVLEARMQEIDRLMGVYSDDLPDEISARAEQLLTELKEKNT